MTMADAKPKRKFRPGLIEADPVENALLVHYEVEEIVDGEVSERGTDLKTGRTEGGQAG